MEAAAEGYHNPTGSHDAPDADNPAASSLGDLPASLSLHRWGLDPIAERVLAATFGRSPEGAAGVSGGDIAGGAAGGTLQKHTPPGSSASSPTRSRGPSMGELLRLSRHMRSSSGGSSTVLGRFIAEELSFVNWQSHGVGGSMDSRSSADESSALPATAGGAAGAARPGLDAAIAEALRDGRLRMPAETESDGMDVEVSGDRDSSDGNILPFSTRPLGGGAARAEQRERR